MTGMAAINEAVIVVAIHSESTPRWPDRLWSQSVPVERDPTP